jgi:class 3 adenylate cyclase/CheY-like chemotaxis protein
MLLVDFYATGLSRTRWYTAGHKKRQPFNVSVTQLPVRIVAAGTRAAALAANAAVDSDRPFTVSVVQSADETIRRVDELAPDIVLVDADAGLTLCRSLKQNPRTVLVPVVILGKSSRERVAALAAGADDFVSGDVSRELLQARIETLVRASAARRELAASQLGEEIRRRDDLRKMFRRYLSPRLADRILEDGNLRNTLLAGADLRVHAVVLFADLRGFTSIAERLSPDAVVLLLNEYFSLLTQITFRHDGTIFHMAGDCLMVGFGVPLSQADAPERAVITAREMLEGFSALAETWKEHHDIETGLGIGINEGEVIAGNVGSAAYMNYTIVGDTVNVASRLCQRARAGEMLFSRSFKRSLDERGVVVDALELPPMTLRGRRSPIDIYCVPLAKRLETGVHYDDVSSTGTFRAP